MRAAEHDHHRRDPSPQPRQPPNNGIIIGADNVTLDLNYHTIDSDGTFRCGCDPTPKFCDIGCSTTATTASRSCTARAPLALGAIVGEVRRQPPASISPLREAWFRDADLRLGPRRWCRTAPRSETESTPIRQESACSAPVVSESSITRSATTATSGLYDENLDRSRLIGNTLSPQSRGGSARERRRQPGRRHSLSPRWTAWAWAATTTSSVGTSSRDSTGLDSQSARASATSLRATGFEHGVSGIDVASYGPARTPSFSATASAMRAMTAWL